MLNQPHIDYAGPTWDSTQTGARKEEKSLFHPVKIIYYTTHNCAFCILVQSSQEVTN